MAAALGLLMGVGTWTFTAWFFVILAFGLLLGAGLQNARRPDWIEVGGGVFFFALGALPWIWAFFTEGFGGYLLSVSPWGSYFSPIHQLGISASYLTGLFMGPLMGGAGFGPVWGGALNPLIAAAAGVGILEMARRRKEPLVQGWALCLALFLAPGLLSSDHVEMFRIILAMPLVLMAAAWGLHLLLGETPTTHRRMTLVLAVVISLGLDGTHLMKVHLASAPEGPQEENYRAYQVLRKQAGQQGPGIIYTDFLLLSHGHSLAACTYPFNAAENPSLDNGQAKWAAVIANVNYGPFLAKRFPDMRWIPVGTDLSSDGGLAVGIIPLSPDGHYLFNQWLETHRYFHGLNLQAEEILNRPDLYAKALKDLPEGEKWMGKDPFLESLFGEWRAQYHYETGNYEKNVEILRETIRKGYPAAHLYFKLGNFLWLEGQKQSAREAYAKAAGQEPHLTQASQALALLGSGQ